MQNIIETYVQYEEWLNLIKDIALLFGFYKFIQFLWEKRFVDKSKQIKSNLEIREELGKKLEKYVHEKFKNGGRDIAVRFIYWKNYPNKIDDDAYKFHLLINDNGKNVLPSGWIDSTGINFQEHVWFLSFSVYVDDKGIFFVNKKGLTIKNFKEVQNCVMILHLPFTNIVNFDFKDFIEYEPIFYIRHAYTNYKKLYDDKIIIREKFGDPYFRLELNRKLRLKKYTWFSYTLLKIKLFLTS